jgi:glutamate-1-semialdehyde 2,1-aminomutase
MKIVAVVQARMGSTRMPEKVMKPIQGTPMIGLMLQRLRRARTLDQIVLATSVDPRNDPLNRYVASQGYEVIRGSENDVLSRYDEAVRKVGADIVVRVTGDCPLIDPQIVDDVVALLCEAGVEYASNIDPPSFPDGLDVEAFTRAALERAQREATQQRDREHVTPYIREGGRFRKANLRSKEDWSGERWTVDEQSDFVVVEKVFAHFAPAVEFPWTEIAALRRQQPEIFADNQHLVRNEGANLGSGQKLWKRAKRVIPGGSMLLSKRAEMFLPEQWPAYYKRAKGCRVWDLDGREYIDMSFMGIGTNTLGYGHPEVDDAVRKVIDDGNMATLNCPEEVYLAERLCELHPWAKMVRFARSGGEAVAVGVRIARAAAGKDKVAICGYHGWHDWYLAANLGDDRGLDGHLLPGLAPNGVPRSLRGSVLPFNYNRIDELEALIAKHEIGVIVMEVSRNFGPTDNFLQNIRDIATQRGIVLVFDECTSGFRQTFGGLHKQFGVDPDMALFGKTLGNGYAVTAVIGRSEVMEAAQTSFISSTFWTERIGSAAALKTLEVMERERSWERITATGKDIAARWQALALHHAVKIKPFGLPALCGYTFDSENALAYKTLVTQEMLAKGFLAGTATYACLEHTPRIVNDYFNALEPVFALVAECENGRDVMSLLKGPICHAGFGRLN